jgi:hypothetical protein
VFRGRHNRYIRDSGADKTIGCNAKEVLLETLEQQRPWALEVAFGLAQRVSHGNARAHWIFSICAPLRKTSSLHFYIIFGDLHERTCIAMQ